MRRFTRLILVLVGLALVLAGPLSLLPDGGLVPEQRASAAFPGVNGKIAFVSTRDGQTDVYVMDPDGNNPTNITNHPSFDFRPAWSPDGTKIAFVSLREGDWGIFVMDANGGNQTRLVNEDMQSKPAWSPDGTKIAFMSRRDGNAEIFVMDADGSNPINLTNNGRFNFAPTWSPDGTRIAFTSDGPHSSSDLFVMDAHGGNQINLTQYVRPSPDVTLPGAWNPDWSPDGTRIVFESQRDGDYDVHVINADGTDQINLTGGRGTSPAWSPDGAKIAFNTTRDGNSGIFVMDADGSNPVYAGPGGGAAWQPLPEECALLLVPGIAGTYSANMQDDVLWLVNRGAHPDQLQIDPLGRVYDDLITSLENVGYTQGEDFFVVNYDWRLPPAPFDGTIDGQISGLTGASITNATFEHSVDYFGHSLRQAVEAHEADDPDSELGCVDVIAHSTGGLVTRSYIQSTAYEDTFTSANGERTLPRVNEFIMLGVPNRGASKAWNPLHDNWVIDPAYSAVLSKIVYRAWLKVTVWNIHVNGPDHTITRASITNTDGEFDPMLFIQQYVPTIGSLLATYDFLDTGNGFTNVNSDPDRRNNLLLDLNDGMDLSGTVDPSPFADRSTVTAIYGTDQRTATGVIQRVGPVDSGNEILPFSDFLPRSAEPGEVWYQDIQPPVSGDGTVPIDSAADQFFGDNRVTLVPLSAATTSGATDHTGLVSNPDVQATILDILGKSFEAGDIASGSGTSYATALSVIFDPVEGFLIDGDGNRLGYSDATGSLNEIPGSLWFGNGDGFGMVDRLPQQPLTISLSGLGEHHVVVVSFADGERFGGAISEGFLELGEQITAPVTIADEPADDPGEPGDPDEPEHPGDGLSAEELLANLIDALKSMDIHHGTKNSRLSQLNAAQRSLERGNVNAACNQLQAFINSVGAQSGKHFSNEQADELREAAGRIREALGC